MHLDDPLWTIVALATIVLLAVAAKIYKNMQGADHSVDRARRGDYDIDAISVLHSVNEGTINALIQQLQSQAESEDTEDTEKEIARGLTWWTFILAAATVYGAIAAFFTLDAIRGQLDEMQKASVDTAKLTSTAIAQIRPWLYISGNIDERARTYLVADVENRGSIIATHISIRAALIKRFQGSSSTPYTSPNDTDISNIECGVRANAPLIIDNPAIPPKNDSTITLDFDYFPKTIKEFLRNRFSAPFLAGCIEYTWPLDTAAVFRTKFIDPVDIVRNGTCRAVTVMDISGIPDTDLSFCVKGPVRYLTAE